MIDMTDAEIAKHWDGNADQWTRDVREGFDVYRGFFTFPAFLEFLPSIDGLDVIDFGCGEGTNRVSTIETNQKYLSSILGGLQLANAVIRCDCEARHRKTAAVRTRPPLLKFARDSGVRWNAASKSLDSLTRTFRSA